MSDFYHDIYNGKLKFEESVTRQNLMRAFAGESQARSRYTFAAGQARREGHEAVARMFEFTAEQERAHARVFYDLLKGCAGESVTVDGSYPVEHFSDTLGHLKAARHNEYQEWEHDYAGFSAMAYEEGFQLIGKQFEMIADIEKTHGDRFGRFADLLEAGKLYLDDGETAWMCLNCGQITHASAAPEECYVCRHGRGFFVRLEIAPYTGA